MTTPPTTTIRPARDADALTLRDHNVAMARETEGLALDPGRALRGVRALLADPAMGHYLVAERGGAVVGQLMVTWEWSDWRAGRIAWIQSVYVTPAARRTGVYRALYGALLADLEADPDVAGVRLYVHRHNDGAQRTYAALGMARADYVIFERDFVIAR